MPEKIGKREIEKREIEEGRNRREIDEKFYVIWMNIFSK